MTPKAPGSDLARSGERLRIGLVTTSFPLREESSSGAFVERLARHLAARHAISVLTPCATAPLSAGAHAPPYQLRCFRYAPWRWQCLAHAPGGIPIAIAANPLLAALAPALLAAMFAACVRLARRVDVIHANWSVCGAVAGVAGRLAGVPVITTLRGADVERARQSAPARALLALALRSSARVTAVSEALAKEATRSFAADPPVAVVPNGVDEAFLTLAPPRVDRRAPLRALMLGSLIERKGCDVALAAFAALDPGSGATLTIAGEGPLRTELENLAVRLGIGERVSFAGAVAPADVSALLERHDCLVLASHAEGRPNVVLEAMAAARPVVASAVPGTIELIDHGHTGLLFADRDSAGLAAHLRALAADRGLAGRIGESARAAILDHGLLWSETARQYLEIYRAAIAGY